MGLEKIIGIMADNTYAILQLRPNKENHGLMFTSLNELKRQGLTPQPENYVFVYGDKITWPDGDISGKLEELYYKFNINKPQNFYGHSLSVSDIVVARKNGTVSYHYVDSVGFKELTDFFGSNEGDRSDEV